MKDKLAKYKMLWNVMEYLNENNVQLMDRKFVLLRSFTLKQSNHISSEMEVVANLLYKRMDKKWLYQYTDNDEEYNYTVFYKIISLGYDKVMEALSGVDVLKNIELVKEDFLLNHSMFPEDYDYEEYEDDKKSNFEEKISQTMGMVEVIKSATHLSETYKSNIEKEVKVVINLVSNIVAGNYDLYDKNDFYEKIHKLGEDAKWGIKYLQDLSKSTNSVFLVDYGYPNRIENIIALSRVSNIVIDSKECTKDYMDSFCFI